MTLTSNLTLLRVNETLLPTATVVPPIDSDHPIVWCAVENRTDSGEDSYQGFLETAQIVTGLFIYPIFCFPGLVGNILTVIVLSRRNMLTSTNAFLSALAVSDSIKLVNDILYFFVILFLRTDPPLGNQAYGYLYPYAHFVFNMSVCVSSWLTVSVAVERYILVCMPTRARAVWSRRRAVMLCTLIYFVMTSLALPSAFRYRTIHCVDRNTSVSRLDVVLTDLWKSNSFVVTYTWAQNLLRSIIPLVILVVLNTCIINALSHTKAKRRRNSRHRVTIMMIVVILAFLICITPDAILSTVFGFGYYEANNLARAIREITDTLLTINAAINFLIYCAFNQVFRKSFAQLCRSAKCKETTAAVGWVTEMDESTYRRLSEAQSSLLSKSNCTPRPETPLSFPDESRAFFTSTPTPEIVSIKIPELETCDNGGDTAKVYDTHHGQHGHFQKLVTNGGCLKDEEDAYSIDGESVIKKRQLLHQLEPRRYVHDPRPGSSRGLKKSKNSLKRGRTARNSSIKQKNEKTRDIVTYIPSGTSLPGSQFRKGSPPPGGSNAMTPRQEERHSDQNGDWFGDRGSGAYSATSSSSSLTQRDTDANAKMHVSNSIDTTDALRSDNDPFKIMVFKESSEVLAANENMTPNNEASALHKDVVQDDRKVDAKHLNMNMINNDLSPVNPSPASKNNPLKESNILGPNKGVRDKKKATLAVSFSDESAL